MRQKITNQPNQLTLYFFDDFPEEYLKRPGIPAALQSAETAFLLMALGRWPAIIGLIWQACELFLRAKYIDPSERHRNRNGPNAFELQKVFFERSDVLTESLHKEALGLRKLRNEIYHEGYSPKFDEVCVEKFFNAGMPYLGALVRDAVDSDLYEILEKKPSRRWLWSLYKETSAVVATKIKKGEPAVSALVMLKIASRKISSIGGMAEDFVVPYNQTESIVQEIFQGSSWDIEQFAIREMVKTLSGGDPLGDAYSLPDFSCPICSEQSVLATMNWEYIDERYRMKNIINVGCYRCEYVLNDADLVNQFFGNRLTPNQVDQIESDGFKPVRTSHEHDRDRYT